MTHVVALVDYKRQNIMQTVFRAAVVVTGHTIRMSLGDGGELISAAINVLLSDRISALESYRQEG